MALSKGNHGVIVIHGIGDKTIRGSLLADISNSLADSLLESKQNGERPIITRDVNLDLDPPSVTLSIKSPAGENATWIFKEAYWDDAFPPPPASSVVWWLLNRNLATQFRYFIRGMKDPANEDKFASEEDKVAEEARKQKKFQEIKDTAKFPTKAKVVGKGGLIGIFIVPLAVITYIALAFIWVSRFLPSIGPLEQVLKWVHKLDPFLSNSFGDVTRYIKHGIWRANARHRLEKVLIDMLNEEYGKLEDITIVAHSMGCVVTYDALAEGSEVARFLNKEKNKKVKITFVSIGSAINQVFRLVQDSPDIIKEHFIRPLAKEVVGFDRDREEETETLKDKFYWLDIYARHDPVSAGALRDRIIDDAKVSTQYQVKRRMVINTDNMIMDHSAYWSNKDTVIPRIARAINNGEVPWEEAGITKEKLENRVKYAAKLGRFTWLVFILALIAAGVCIYLWVAGII